MSIWFIAPLAALLCFAFAFRALENSGNPALRRRRAWGIVLATSLVCFVFQLQRAKFSGMPPARVALELFGMAALPAIFPLEAMWLARVLTRKLRPLWLYLIAYVVAGSTLWAITVFLGVMLTFFFRL